MGILDEHNHQHTFQNTFGPPTTVVGVSAQQTIETQRRLAEGSAGQGASGSAALESREALILAGVCGVIAGAAAMAAFMIGGIAALALALVTLIAGFLCALFAFSALLGGAHTLASSTAAALGNRRLRPWWPVIGAAAAGWTAGQVFWMAIAPLAPWHLATTAACLALAAKYVPWLRPVCAAAAVTPLVFLIAYAWLPWMSDLMVIAVTIAAAIVTLAAGYAMRGLRRARA